ncbi:MAG: tetratricopeptide repeat protein [Robiginitomaculum sp.]
MPTISKTHAVSKINVRPVIRQTGQDIPAASLMRAANTAFAAGDYSAALKAYRQIYWDDDSNAPARLGLADCELIFGNAKNALTHYDALLTVSGSHTLAAKRVMAGRALARQSLGIADDVEVELNAALEYNLTDIRLWNGLGRFYDSQGRTIEAQETYVRALRAGADPAVTINNMGMSLLLEGRYAQALDKFNQANALAPDTGIFDNNRRLVLALQGNYPAATQNMSEARGAKLYNDAGYLAMTRKDLKRAETLLRRALALSPVHMAQAEANLKALSGLAP